MTQFTYEPAILSDALLKKARSLSNDPIRQVGAALFVNWQHPSVFLGANAVTEELSEVLDWTDRPLVRSVIRHAEVSAVLNALQNGIKKSELQDSTMLVTLQPCEACSALLRHLRIGHVIFGEFYVPSDQTDTN